MILQTALTHQSKAAIDATYLYCLAIQKLIQGEKNEAVYNAIKMESANFAGDSKDPIHTWFNVVEKGPLPRCDYKQTGFLKIAFVWAFYFLKKNTPYIEAVKEMIGQGGDTDTNAAIVGGLLGAAQGLTSIAAHQIEALLSVRPDKPGFTGRPRPAFLVPCLYLP